VYGSGWGIPNMKYNRGSTANKPLKAVTQLAAGIVKYLSHMLVKFSVN